MLHLLEQLQSPEQSSWVVAELADEEYSGFAEPKLALEVNW